MSDKHTLKPTIFCLYTNNLYLIYLYKKYVITTIYLAPSYMSILLDWIIMY